MKRKHQIEFEKTIADIIAGSPVRNIVCDIIPGGGKSSLPVAACKLIDAGLVDKIAWLCPRLSLQDQGERAFISPFMRGMFGVRHSIRSSVNDADPCRGTNGWIGTYQAAAVDNMKTALADFRSRRYILVLDELQHLADNGDWSGPVRELYEHAKYRILMSGTLSRHDRKKISFISYEKKGDGLFMPDFQGNEETAAIRYGRVEALRERAIIPMTFFFSEGTAKWQKLTGKIVEAKLSTAKDQSHALFTALNTEYATELLAATVDHWSRHRVTTNPNAKLLVVCAQIKDAEKMTAQLKAWGRHALIATSDDSKDALKAIKSYKAGRVKILVSVSMASEGLDVPEISHIACLTRIRSKEWLDQCLARAVRIDPAGGPYSTQRAFIFAPNDVMFREIAAKIEADQTDPAVEQHKGNGKQALEADGGFELEGADMRAPGGITPLSSRLTGYNEMPLFGGMGSMAMDPPQEIRTNREQENDLLGAIEAHIRRYSFQNRHNPKRLNAEIYSHFGGKARRQMDIRELEEVLAWVQQRYPAGYIRGTGNMRVPMRAHRVAVQWR